MENSTLFSLKLRDFGKGLLIALGAAVFTSLAAALNTPGFDFSAFDFGELLRVALAAGMAYIVKNYFSDENGRLMGKI